MHELQLLIFTVIVLALLFDYINGFHDTANAIATSVSTRAIHPSHAIMMAAVLNFAGAMYSTGVAKTIGADIVKSAQHVDEHIIIAALVFRTLSVGVEAGSNSLRRVDSCIEEASATLGANNFYTFCKVSLPLMRSALFSGLLNAFVRSMTSVSAVIFLVSVDWNLLTVSIMSEIESSRLGVASSYCVVLMIIVLIALFVLEVFANGIGRQGRRLNHGSRR